MNLKQKCLQLMQERLHLTFDDDKPIFEIFKGVFAENDEEFLFDVVQMFFEKATNELARGEGLIAFEGKIHNITEDTITIIDDLKEQISFRTEAAESLIPFKNIKGAKVMVLAKREHPVYTPVSIVIKQKAEQQKNPNSVA